MITDASYCSKSGAAGWAAWIAPDIGERQRYSGEFKTTQPSSTWAELRAAYNGLHLAYLLGARTILLQSDCVVIATALNKPNGKYGFREFRDLYLPDLKEVNYRHVKGHDYKNRAARSWVNRWCDQEARAHMRRHRASLSKPYTGGNSQ